MCAAWRGLGRSHPGCGVRGCGLSLGTSSSAWWLARPGRQQWTQSVSLVAACSQVFLFRQCPHPLLVTMVPALAAGRHQPPSRSPQSSLSWAGPGPALRCWDAVARLQPAQTRSWNLDWALQRILHLHVIVVEPEPTVTKNLNTDSAYLFSSLNTRPPAASQQPVNQAPSQHRTLLKTKFTNLD